MKVVAPVSSVQSRLRTSSGQKGARLAATVLALFLGGIVLSGCGNGDNKRPLPPHPGGGGEGGAGPGLGGAGGTGGSDVGQECEDGTQKECTVYVEQASGVTSCWKGVKFCVDGGYTECLDPGSAFPTTGADPS